MNISEAVERIFEKSEILYKGEVISKEKLIGIYASFVSDTMDKSNHNVGLVMHSGSICFDVVSIVVAAVMNMISNETSSKQLLESLEPNDIVIYKDKRYQFVEIINDEENAGKKHAVLKQKNDKLKVPELSWRLITPYNGKSKCLDGRGIKKKKSLRDDFFVDVLGFEEADIPSVIDTSCVLITSRERADLLIKEVGIRFDGKKVNLLDLVTASYFSDEEEYSYGGNAGKNEAVLKMCGRVSVARSLILGKNGNNHIGLMVLGEETINKGKTELPELINRKKLKYVYISTTIDSDYEKELFSDENDLELFACTKDFLKEYGIKEVSIENEYTRSLSKQINNIVNKKVNNIDVSNFPISEKEYVHFKNLLLFIKQLDYSSQEKDDFIVQAHSLMNLYKTAVFSIFKMEKAKEKGLIAVDTPDIKINHLKGLIDSLPNSVKEKALEVVEFLSAINSRLYYENPKSDCLNEYLFANRDKSIAVVVPKAYYINVIKSVGLTSISKVDYMTAGRFDKEKSYDSVIAVGDFVGKRFDSLRCNSATEIINILYSVEKGTYRRRERLEEHERRELSSKSYLKIRNLGPEIDYQDSDETIFLEEADNELDNFVSVVDNISFSESYSYGGTGRSNLTAEIVAVGILEDERRVFFSKHYKAYVFDSNAGATREVGTLDLCDGDSVVFTKNNENTKDIVDSMLMQLIDDNKLSQETVNNYEKSKSWQKALWDYTESNELSEIQVAEKIIELGAPIQIMTILRWMDEDSHTVGPRNKESLKVIGKLTGIEDMENNPDIYFEACREIRKIRRKLLDQIGVAIIDKLSGKKPNPGTIFADIYDKIDDLSEVLQIDRIIPTEKTMPLGLANRPINLRGE